MCEHREIDLPERIIYAVSPLDARPNKTYLATVKTRATSWTRLTSQLNKGQFHDCTRALKLTEFEKQHLWILLAFCNYHLISPLAFFDFLMETAIEERVTLTSYATAEALRKIPGNPIPQGFQDNFLVFLYLAIRDGARAFSLLNTLEVL
jgi:hypothetical protein